MISVTYNLIVYPSGDLSIYLIFYPSDDLSDL